MTVRLRPHHLLCILTYVGKGYSPAFTANMSAIVERLSAGEEVEIVEGPDEICAPLHDDPEAHCRCESVSGRDRAAAKEVGELLALTVQSGTRFVLSDARIRTLRHAFARGHARSACAQCEWSDLCGSVAASGFTDAFL